MNPLRIRYRNWRGEVAIRTIVPIRMIWGATEWHPEKQQWLLQAVDQDKQAERTFAVVDILEFLHDVEAMTELPDRLNAIAIDHASESWSREVSMAASWLKAYQARIQVARALTLELHGGKEIDTCACVSCRIRLVLDGNEIVPDPRPKQ